MDRPVPVLFDTDIGSDIDDAVALAYLLAQPRCELLGITTVTGEVGKRSALADALCQAAGREDVPIHSGAEEVLLYGPGQPLVPQYEAIVRKPHRADFPASTAVDFLRRTIRGRPGEITLLSVGPLTNIALLFAIDPEIHQMLGQLVSMAGIFFNPSRGAEWNCSVDPVATAMVYGARLRRHLSVGLDVTTRCRMPAEEVRSRFKEPPLDLVKEIAEVWFRDRREITFHDPLAAALVFRPEICELAQGEVKVDPGPGGKAGTTRFACGDGMGSHEVARTVNPEAFFREFFGVFSGQ
jgi:purine nucleosidase